MLSEKVLLTALLFFLLARWVVNAYSLESGTNLWFVCGAVALVSALVSIVSFLILVWSY